MKRLGNALKRIEDAKMEAVKMENYTEAKKLKMDTDQLKGEIDRIAHEFYDPLKKEVRPMKYHEKIQHLLDGFG